MKLFRIIYFALTALLYLTARYTGRREFFLLFFMTAFVALYALALNLWTALAFSYVQELEEKSAVKGSSPKLRLSIHNDKPFPFTLMQVRVDTALPSQKAVLGFNLSPRSSIRFELPLYCAYRGEYDVGKTTVEISDIFGLFNITYDMRLLPYYRQRRLRVYPRLVSLPFLPAGSRDAKLVGAGTNHLSDAGDSYADLRQHRPGDPMKRVHWPASARAREVMVKCYELPAESAVLIALDTAASGFEGEDALRYADLACECAAAVAAHCLTGGFAVCLIDANPDRLPIREDSWSGFARVYDHLASLPFCEGKSLANHIRAETKDTPDIRAIYIFTSVRDAFLDQVMGDLTRAGISVRLLLLGASAASIAGSSVMPGVSVTALPFGVDVAAALGGLT